MKCTNCGAESREGEYICQSCGQLILPPTTRLSAKTDLFAEARSSVEVAAVETIVFDIAGRLYQFPARDGLKILIGRGNVDHPPENGMALDLHGIGGEQNGVSRRHAMVRIRDQEAYLVDLGSTNGTYLNGKKIEAMKQNALYTGDRIHFGRLEARIQLV